MTPDEIALATALGQCSYPPATANKRFARNMAFLAKNSPEKELSDRQRHYMQQMAWTYRRQIPAHLVPVSKPTEMPPKEKPPSKRKPKEPAGDHGQIGWLGGDSFP
jgi:hypothetical protein